MIMTIYEINMDTWKMREIEVREEEEENEE